MNFIPLETLIEHHGSYNNIQVETKGYLYQDASGQHFVSTVPNIPCCCIGKKTIPQLPVDGIFPMQLPAQASTVKGIIVSGNMPRMIEGQLEDFSGNIGIGFIAMLFLTCMFPILLWSSSKKRC